MQIRTLTWYALRRQTDPETLAFFFRETVFGFFLAPSEENANLNCGLVHIPPQITPGAWAFLFWLRRLWVPC